MCTCKLARSSWSTPRPPARLLFTGADSHTAPPPPTRHSQSHLRFRRHRSSEFVLACTSKASNLFDRPQNSIQPLTARRHGAGQGGEDATGPRRGDPGEGRDLLLLPTQGGQGRGARPRRRAAHVHRPAPRVRRRRRPHRRGEAGAGLRQGRPQAPPAGRRRPGRKRGERRGWRPRQGGAHAYICECEAAYCIVFLLRRIHMWKTHIYVT